jgi:uncharacterized membrane protein
MTEPRWPARLGAALAVPVGALTGILQVALAGRAFADCDAGINAAANSFTLTLVVPFAIAIDAVTCGFVFTVAYRATAQVVRAERRWVAFGAAVLAALLAMALLVWAGMAVAMPAESPDHICPGNAPPWWPSWLPI